MAWSPDWRSIASSSLDNTIQVWDASTGAHITTYRGHRLPAQMLSWSPDSREIVSGSLDQTAQVWGVTTGETIRTYRGHSAPVTTVMWSPDGTRIASGSVDTTVQVWDASTGKVRYSYDGSTIAGARIDNAQGVPQDLIFFVAWSHNGKRIAAVTDEYSGDCVVITWDAQTGKHLVPYFDQVM